MRYMYYRIHAFYMYIYVFSEQDIHPVYIADTF